MLPALRDGWARFRSDRKAQAYFPLLAGAAALLLRSGAAVGWLLLYCLLQEAVVYCSDIGRPLAKHMRSFYYLAVPVFIYRIAGEYQDLTDLRGILIALSIGCFNAFHEKPANISFFWRNLSDGVTLGLAGSVIWTVLEDGGRILSLDFFILAIYAQHTGAMVFSRFRRTAPGRFPLMQVNALVWAAELFLAGLIGVL